MKITVLVENENVTTEYKNVKLVNKNKCVYVELESFDNKMYLENPYKKIKIYASIKS